VRARLLALAAAALIPVASILAPGAEATPPRVAAISPGSHSARVTFLGYDLVGGYGVELSRSRRTRDGHFARPVRTATGLRLGPGLTRTVSFRALPPGRYYVRVSHDGTAAYRARWARLCRRFGCRSPWHGRRVLEWSGTTAFTVR
jgi:hypothetical protein